MSEEKTPEQEKEEIRQRRAAKRAEIQKEQDVQEVKDLRALEKLEDEHPMVSAIKMERFIPGQPTRVFLRPPTRAEYKRYKTALTKGVTDKRTKDVTEAQDQLARSCILYPLTTEERESLYEAYSGILTSIGIAALRLAENTEEDEGKD